jgi:hypothetical protein
MDRETIIKLAHKAESPEWGDWFTDEDALERFAKLVRDDYSFTHAQLWIKRINDAVAAERKECEKVCIEHWLNGGNAMECADTIRARGTHD